MKSFVAVLCLALFVVSTQAFFLGMDGSDFMAYSMMSGGSPFRNMFGGRGRPSFTGGAQTRPAAGGQQQMPFGNNWLGLAYLSDGMF